MATTFTGDTARRAINADVHDFGVPDELSDYTGPAWVSLQYRYPLGGRETCTGSWSVKGFSQSPSWGYNAVSKDGETLNSGTIRNRVEKVRLEKGKIVWPEPAQRPISSPSAAEQGGDTRSGAPSLPDTQASRTARPYQATVEDVPEGWEVIDHRDARLVTSSPTRPAPNRSDSSRDNPDSSRPMPRSAPPTSFGSTDRSYSPADSQARNFSHAVDPDLPTGSQEHRPGADSKTIEYQLADDLFIVIDKQTGAYDTVERYGGKRVKGHGVCHKISGRSEEEVAGLVQDFARRYGQEAAEQCSL